MVLRRHSSLAQFRSLRPDFRELSGRLGAKLVIDLDDLQFELGNRALDLGQPGDERAALALEPCLLALQRGNLLNRRKLLLEETPFADQLVFDQRDLSLSG